MGNKLSAKLVDSLREPGTYEDGAGLRLVIGQGGSKSWIFRYQLQGRRRQMGLGPYPAVTLKAARDAAAACRVQISQKIDPIEAKREMEEEAERVRAKAPTFRECTEEYIQEHRAGWKHEEEYAGQWTRSLSTYAFPHIGDRPVDEVDTTAVRTILSPIWRSKPEIASRVRGRLELILDFAKANGKRSGENPARWRGHLAMLLPSRSKVRAVVHQPAMPRGDLARFMNALVSYRGSSAKALRLTILTACRSSEVLNATWPEFDLQEHVWTIPAKRMKGGRNHRIPLTEAMLEILRGQLGQHDHWVFPGRKYDKPLCKMAMLKVMRDMNLGHFVPHGFRSTFRDWAAECTQFPSEVVEMALAHTIENQVEAAYRRGDLFEKRRTLMGDWSKYATSDHASIGGAYSVARQPSVPSAQHLIATAEKSPVVNGKNLN